MLSSSPRRTQPAFRRCAAFRSPIQRTALDYIMQGDYTQSFGSHTLGAGVSYDLSRVFKYYSFTLQPNNYLSPIETPSTPNAPTR